MTSAELQSFEPQVRAQIESAQTELSHSPGSASAIGGLGMLLHAYRWLDRAHAWYRRAAQVDPQDYRWPYLLARVSLETGSANEVEEWLARSLVNRRDYLPALLLRGELALKNDRPADARTAFEEAAKCSPRSAPALCGLGEALRLEGKLDEAQQMLEAALEIEPRYGKALYQLSLVTRARGDTARAEELLLRHASALKLLEVEDPALEAVDALRRDSDQIFRAANVLFRDGKLSEALRAYDEALSRNPNLAMAHYDAGLALQQLGRPREAVSRYEAFLQKQPGSPDALNNLGLCALELAQQDQAITWFEKAIAADPSYVKARTNLAGLYLQSKKDASALRQIFETLRIDPLNEKALSLFLAAGGSSLDSGRYRKAASVLKSQRLPESAKQLLLRGRSEEPQDWRNTVALAWLLATCPEESVRDPAGAVRLVQPLVESNIARDPTALDTLAAALAAEGRFEEAAKAAALALELAPPEKQAQAIRQRLQLYGAKKAYREE